MTKALPSSKFQKSKIDGRQSRARGVRGLSGYATEGATPWVKDFYPQGGAATAKSKRKQVFASMIAQKGLS